LKIVRKWGMTENNEEPEAQLPAEAQKPEPQAIPIADVPKFSRLHRRPPRACCP
jgi:hypothetical protein